MPELNKVKPLSRQDVMHLAVTDADAFTANRFLRHRESTPSIPDLEEKGQESLPGIEGSLLDLYHSLWAPEPAMKEEVPADRRYWHKLLGETIKSSQFQELHAQTELRELQSVLGTVAMGESVIALVPKEDKEKLQKVQKAQEQADKAEEQAQGLQAQADALQNAADDAAAEANGQGQGQGEGKPSDGKSDGQPQSGSGRGQMSPAQAKAIADELAKQAAEAKAKTQSAQGVAEEAKLQAEIAAEELLGKPGKQADAKLRELARIGIQAAKNTQVKVEEVSKTIEAWGLDVGELQRKSIPETLGLLERMKRSEALKKFASLLGRIRMIAARKARSKITGEGVKIATVETGRDLKRAQRSEIIALTNPSLRVKALTRWTRGELRLSGQKTKAKLGHGPVIVCEDGSGSMDGAKQQWAKAVVLSLAHYAKLQKRSFGWILFDAVVHRSNVYPAGNVSPEQMLELVEARAGGGTDFEKPLRKALEMVKQAGLKKADICFITDGECAVSNEFLQEFKVAKKALEINVFTVLCDTGSSSNSAIQEFSDRIEKASTFTAEEAEARVFRHL
ncbi:MAG: VWA domain-containing protein [bacterium]